MIPTVRLFAWAPHWLGGTAHAPGTILRGWSERLRWRAAAEAAAVMLAVLLCQQLALLGWAQLVCWLVGQGGLTSLAEAGGADSIYSRLVLGMLGNALPAGIAIRLPFDQALQSVLPGFYAGSSLPVTAWIGVVFASGSSAVGAQLVQTSLNLGFVGVGCAAIVATLITTRVDQPGGSSRRLLRVASLFGLAAGAGSQLQLSWTDGSPGEMALSMVATKLLGMDRAAYDATLSHSTWVTLAFNLAGVFGAAAVGTILAMGICWLCRQLSLARPTSTWALRRIDWRAAGPVGAAALLLVSPLQHGAAFQDEARSVNMDLESASRTPKVEATFLGPSVVTVTNENGGFVYRVNGSPQSIRGVGYNAITKDQATQDRLTRYQRDFAAIRGMGANTITGWDVAEFDQTLMLGAAEAGLGVILPLDLPPGSAYGDAATQEQLLTDVLDRVERFKDDPALRIWGLGNEVIHDRVDKRMSDSSAFAEFLIRAADRIHALDPDHPVIYRDAEDVYLQPVARALLADGMDRPWFVYGMNFFTTRLQAALADGPARRLEHPLLVSEFAPVGLRGVGRAVVYQQLWKIISANRGLVLGGCAYVWTTDGPEPLDRAFGLTNADGEAVDSSFSTLASLFATGEAEDAGQLRQSAEK